MTRKTSLFLFSQPKYYYLFFELNLKIGYSLPIIAIYHSIIFFSVISIIIYYSLFFQFSILYFISLFSNHKNQPLYFKSVSLMDQNDFENVYI